MAVYEKPQNTASQIDKAGANLANRAALDSEFGQAIQALWNWRSAHSLPLNIIYMTLRRRALKIDSQALAAQRLKRFESIMNKLDRQRSMKMSRMQDIGGCRAIVSSVDHLYLLKKLYEQKPLAHELSGTRDYVENPKDSGYRGIHLMYRYRGSTQTQAWDRLRVEIQMRTTLQHAWATAVETVDTFTTERLKAGEGSIEWKRFFALMGTVHALKEQTAIVPGTPAEIEQLRAEVRDLNNRLKIVDSLKYYAGAVSHIIGSRNGTDYWYLLEFDIKQKSITIESFSRGATRKARDKYDEMEQRSAGLGTLVVMVSSKSMAELQTAYPNYFADTKYFTATLEDFIA